MYLAVRGGHLHSLEVLLSHEKVNPNKKFPLMAAVEKGSVELVKMLLLCTRINVNQHRHNSPRTALVAAVVRKDFEIVRLLLKHETDTKVDPNLEQPLVKAVKKESVQIVEMLLACPRINVNQKESPWDDTVLIAAVRRKNLEIVWLLLKHETGLKVDINAVVEWPTVSTALDIAFEENATEIIEVLHGFGAKTWKELQQTGMSHGTVRVDPNELEQDQETQRIAEGPLALHDVFLPSRSVWSEELRNYVDVSDYEDKLQ